MFSEKLAAETLKNATRWRQFPFLEKKIQFLVFFLFIFFTEEKT